MPGLEGSFTVQHGKELPQYVSTILATLAVFSIGTYLSWTSPALPLFNREDSLTVSDAQGSWIGSLLPLAALLGAIPAGLIADKIGRKRSILVFSVPLLLCWLPIGFANDIAFIYVGRVIAGFASGACTVVIPMYVSEIAEARIRGSLGTLFQLQITIGILFAYATGFTGDLHCIAILCAIAPAVLLLCFPFAPESPVWLLTQGKCEEAESSLQRLRGNKYNIQNEINQLQMSIASQGERAGIVELRYYKKAIVITICLMIFQQLSGVNTVIFYADSIFIAAGSTLSPTVSSAVVGVVQVIATYGSTVLVDRLGRKILLLISDLVMGICLVTLSGYFYFMQSHDLSSISWLPLLSLAVFIVIFSLGYGPIPWLMVGELFPNNVRGVASSVTASCNWILAFAVTKFFQNMIDLMGISMSFLVFAMICFVGTTFVALVVPETKGKTIDEVQIELYGLNRELPAKSRS